MLKKVLLLSGSFVFVMLGLAHLYYTFINNKFKARDEAVNEGMKNTHPLLTQQTTMWEGWIGFNTSHSLGVIFFGTINIVLATQYYPVIANSLPLQILNLVVCFCYLALAVKYWFKTPLLDIGLATLCYILALLP